LFLALIENTPNLAIQGSLTCIKLTIHNQLNHIHINPNHFQDQIRLFF